MLMDNKIASKTSLPVNVDGYKRSRAKLAPTKRMVQRSRARLAPTKLMIQRSRAKLASTKMDTRSRAKLALYKRMDTQMRAQLAPQKKRGACLAITSSRKKTLLSSQNVVDDMSVDICETEISTLETIDEFLVVNPEEVEHRGMEVVDMDDIFNGVVSQFVGVPVADAAFDSATCHPH